MTEQIKEYIKVAYLNGTIDGKQGTEVFAQDTVLNQLTKLVMDEFQTYLTQDHERIVRELEKEKKRVTTTLQEAGVEVDTSVTYFLKGVDNAIAIVNAQEAVKGDK